MAFTFWIYNITSDVSIKCCKSLQYRKMKISHKETPESTNGNFDILAHKKATFIMLESTFEFKVDIVFCVAFFLYFFINNVDILHLAP